MNPAVQEYAALAGRIALFPFTYVINYVYQISWTVIRLSLVVPSQVAFNYTKGYVSILEVSLKDIDYQQQALVVGNLVLRVVLFPFTHVLFYIVLGVWLVVKHVLVVPLLLMLRITLFGLVYLPLTPMLTAADVDYDKSTTVEGLLLQLVVHSAPHVAFFTLHLLHYVIIALVTGAIVGWFTGLNLSLVSKVFTPPPLEEAIQEEITKTKAKMDELKAQLPKIEELKPKAEELIPLKSAVKKEPEEQLAPAELSVADIVQNEPKSTQRGKVDFSATGTELAYEDDDGYNYMRYKDDEPPKPSRDPPVATIKEEPEEAEEEIEEHLESGSASGSGTGTAEGSEELGADTTPLLRSQKKRRQRRRKEAAKSALALALALTPATANTPGFSDVGEASTAGTEVEEKKPGAKQ